MSAAAPPALLVESATPVVAVQLPVGLWRDGVHHRQASLVPLSGAAEERIGNPAGWSSPAARVTNLLALTVVRLGALAPPAPEDIRGLCVLDRDVLLIALRRMIFGDRIQATVPCPSAECGHPVDIGFDLGDLPIPERDLEPPPYMLHTGGRLLTFRLPNGGDQEAVAQVARTDVPGAERLLIERCAALAASDLSDEEVARLRPQMSSRDPQIDNELAAICPDCSHTFSVHFDVQDYLLEELDLARHRLYEQVHTLAWYYHWSEAEILGLPLQRRRTYLRLLSDVLSVADGDCP